MQHTTTTRLARLAICGTLLLSLGAQTAHAQAWRAAASTDTIACGNPDQQADGGAGATVARRATDRRNACGDTVARVAASAGTSLASGVAFAATGLGNTPDTDRAIARSDYADVVQLSGVPDDQATVELRVTITLVADGDIAPDDPGNFLFGRITVPGGGDFELRRCSIQVCPDDPIASDLLSELVTIPRLGPNGDFPSIGVAAAVTLESRGGGGFLWSETRIDILNAPAARLTSLSGLYGTDVLGDDDQDGVPNALDNCRERANRLQRDSNTDGFGNACDADLNNDGIVNIVDAGRLRNALFATGDHFDADADLNGDGVVDTRDVGLLRLAFFLPPGP